MAREVMILATCGDALAVTYHKNVTEAVNNFARKGSSRRASPGEGADFEPQVKGNGFGPLWPSY
jgi:hypothetical protein